MQRNPLIQYNPLIKGGYFGAYILVDREYSFIKVKIVLNFFQNIPIQMVGALLRSPFSMTLDFSHFNSLFSLVRHFNSNDVCKTFLAEARWGEDVVCPYCGEHHCSRCKDGRFTCEDVKLKMVA